MKISVLHCTVCVFRKTANAHCREKFCLISKSKFFSEGIFLYRGFSLLQSEHPLFFIFLDYFSKEFLLKLRLFRHNIYYNRDFWSRVSKRSLKLICWGLGELGLWTFWKFYRLLAYWLIRMSACQQIFILLAGQLIIADHCWSLLIIADHCWI